MNQADACLLADLRREAYFLERERKAHIEKALDCATKIQRLELQIGRLEHPCDCVKLNGDIEVYDSGEQHRRGRTGLALGLVAETLSARKDCERCKGTGVPSGGGT